jgi:uracil DNA glycosylase
MQHLNDHSSNIVFLLWGKDAQIKGAQINKVISLEFLVQYISIIFVFRHDIMC